MIRIEKSVATRIDAVTDSALVRRRYDEWMSAGVLEPDFPVLEAAR
jgi:hypothetical protein